MLYVQPMNAVALDSRPIARSKLVGPATYTTCMVALGCLAVIAALSRWTSEDPLKFGVYLLIAGIGASLKLALPGAKGTMPVGFVFVLVGIMELSLPEVMVIAIAAVIIKEFRHPETRPQIMHVLFYVACMCVAVMTTDAVYRSAALRAAGVGPFSVLAVATCTLFMANTFPNSCVTALTSGRSLGKVWREDYVWSFPYYIAGAAAAGGFNFLSRSQGWQSAIVAVPLFYVVYRSYRLHVGRLEAEKAHAQHMAGLHMRTIEALALAIDAKDTSSHDRMRRMQAYSEEIGKELGVEGAQLDALRAAAVLHDIGKLAVPEPIVSKAGKLTPEEFEKMKIHPMVGAEILGQVGFPYPVVPLVLAHHEKWDGSGYPYGLKGEDIPLGARILAVIDYLDVLLSEQAMSLDDAMALVVKEANHAFDAKVVDVLSRRCRELERSAQLVTINRPALSSQMKIARGLEPGAGFETSNSDDAGADFVSCIASATHEAQALFELSQSLGNSLSLNETLSVLAIRLKRIVPHDAIAIYLVKDEVLIPEYVQGDELRQFSSVRIPVGEGLSGWVAHNNKAILNGNPSVESAYLTGGARPSSLRSALAVPLVGVQGVVGVLALYQAAKDAFSNDHLRVLLALSSKVAFSVENAVRFQKAESSATTDYLTGLPNARSLFLQLDSELARCKRSNGELCVIVCDLDGFKQINDRFGHLEGNRVLQSIGQGMRESCREYDYVARMGGDEFVLILPNLPKEIASVKIEDIREIVRKVGQTLGDDSIGISVGEAYYPEDGMDAEDLLAQADRRMYQVKQTLKGDATRQAFGVLTRALAEPSAAELPAV
jgi:diguanylate cyclase (GGDEF)-like protein/putative nucleotidyltransferase with HDIG domain